MNKITDSDILKYYSESRIGFWKLEVIEGAAKRLYPDDTMREIIGTPDDLTPEECCAFFDSHIFPEDRDMMRSYAIRMKDGDSEIIYRYDHPERGGILVRCNGRVTESGDGVMTMVGQHQEITDAVRLGNGLELENRLLTNNMQLRNVQRKTDDYYKNLLDMATCGILSYTLPDRRLLHMNAEAIRIFGFSSAEETWENMGDLLRKTTYSDPCMVDKLLKLHEENGIVDYECLACTASGKPANLIARTEVFITPQGERSVFTTFIDVSENAALRNDKSILEALCTDFSCVYLCDLDDDSLFCVKCILKEESERAKEVLGKDSGRFSARIRFFHDTFIVREESPDFLSKLNARYLKDYLSRHERFFYRFSVHPRMDGHTHFELSIVRLKSDDGFKIVMGFRFIDELLLEEERQQKLIENTMADSVRKNDIIVAISKQFWQVFSVDLRSDTYKEVFTNDHFTMDSPGFAGFAHEDFLSVVNKYTDEAYRAQMRVFVDNTTLPKRLQNTDTISIEYKTIDGVWASARYIAKNRDASGKVEEVLFLLQIIDEQKRRELNYQKELEKSAEEARRANEAKTNFLRRMSHDMRTPLNGIIGLLKINEGHFDNLELVRENQKKMWISANHLLSLINDVLEMSKLEDGNIILTHEYISLVDLTQDIVSIIIGRAVEAGIGWDYERGKSRIPYPYIYGSPVHLRQIFLNVYGNCIKYNRPGGRITTIVDTLDEHDGIGTYRWIISDTGIGMSEEFLKHIYDPFAQERNGSDGSSQGIGLGMAIVKGLIDQMGGSITITSKEGVGSTFEIIIPFEIAPAPEDITKQLPEKEGDIRGLNLMLVEDNELNSEIAEILLSDHGAHVTTVHDGRDALDLFSSSPEGQYDAILMDIMMPVMDGITATHEIRKLNRKDAKSIPIIAMTANAFKEDADKCIAAGMNAHLAKPLDMDKVTRIIQEQVSKH